MKLARSLAGMLAIPMFSIASPSGARQQTIQAALQPAASRVQAPSFALPDAAGKPHRLSDFAGTPVVLNLWATDCGGCKAELPTFVALHRGHADQLRVVGVSLDVMYEDLKSTAEGWAKVTPFARSHGLLYTILVDDGSVEKAYSVTAMPATYLIDNHGRIAAKYIGVVDSADLTSNVKALIAERD